MALNKKRLEDSQRRTKRGGKFWKCSNGKNIIRVFSFPHVVTKADIVAGLYPVDTKLGTKFDEVDREVSRHFTDDGIVNCFLVNCKYCKESDELLSSHKKEDKDLGNDIKAGKAYYVNLVDMGDVDSGIKVGSLAPTVYNVIVSYINDPEYGEAVLGNEGRDFIIEYDKDQHPQKMYTVKLRDEKHCEKLNETLQSEVQDLFINKMLSPGWSKDSDGEEESSQVEEDKSIPYVEPKTKSSPKNAPAPTTIKKGKPSEPKEEEEDLKDEVLPWEKSDEVAVPESEEKWPYPSLGDTVNFTEGSEVLEGIIRAIDGKNKTGAVHVGTDIYDIPFAEMEVISKAGVVKKTPNSRKRS